LGLRCAGARLRVPNNRARRHDSEDPQGLCGGVRGLRQIRGFFERQQRSSLFQLLYQPIEWRIQNLFVHGTGGSLAGAIALPAAAIDLTAEGISDWAHWGLSAPTSFDHKAGVSQQINTFANIGTANAQQ